MNGGITSNDIEIGTFLTKDEGLPTMGLMLQTSNAIELKQHILNNEAIVNGLLHFIKHCDKMIESYEFQLKGSFDGGQFLEDLVDEWSRKKNDLIDLIEFKTINIQRTNHE